MKKYQKNTHTGFSANMITAEYNRRGSSDTFWTRLASEIVIAAVKDWRHLIERKAWRCAEKAACNFTELRMFFNSEWCAFLMNDFELAPERMLALLERELEDAKRKDEIESWR